MILSTWSQFFLFLGAVVSLVVVSVPSNVQMGSDYFDSFQFDEAYRYFSKAQKDNANDLSNLKRLKDYFIVKGETDKALNLQEKLVKLRPKNVGYWKDLGQLYDWNLRPYDKLRALEEEAKLLTRTEQTTLYLEIAEGYRWMKKFPDANRIYSILLHHDDPRVLDQALAYYASTRQVKEALALMEKLSHQSRNPVYERWLAEYAEANGDYESANRHYRKILALAFGNPFDEKNLRSYDKTKLKENLFYLQKLNQNYYRMEKKSEGHALQDRLKEALPGEPLLAYDRAYRLQEEGNFSEAILAFREVELTEKDSGKVFGICQNYEGMNADAEAVRCLNTLLKTHPRNLRFLEELGDIYERTGNKAEALRIFEKILKLQGEEEAKVWKLSELVLYAQNGALTQMPEMKKSPGKLREEKLNQLRQKVINLRYDMGENRRSRKLMETQVEKHPENISYRKQLGYYYQDEGLRSEMLSQFEAILRLDPEDPDALRVALEEDYRKGNLPEVMKKLKKLPVRNDLGELEFREEVYREAGEDKLYEKLCLSYAGSFPEMALRCEFRLGDKAKAIDGLEKLSQEKPTHTHRTLLVNWYLETRKTKEARAELTTLRKEKKFMENNRLQESELTEVERELKSRRDWFVDARSFTVSQRRYHYNQTSVDLLKKMNGPGAGLWLERVTTRDTFTLLSPYLYYGHDRGELKAGPTFTSGKKDLSTPFFLDASWFGMKNIFASAHFENSRPEYLLSGLAAERKSYRQVTSAYVSYRNSDKDIIDLSLTRNVYTFDTQSGRDLQLYSEYLHQGLLHENFSLGTRIFHTDLQDAGTDVKRLHIQKALAYYAVLQFSNSFLRTRHHQWNYLAKAAFGGDAYRGIGFGKAQNFRVQLDYLWSDQKGLSLYADYIKESYLAAVSEMNIMGLRFTTHF